MHHDQNQPPRSRALRRLHATPVRIILTVLACALPAVPVIMLVQNDIDSRGFQPLGSLATPLAPPKDNYYGVPTTVYSADSSTPADLCVTFEFLGLEPSVPNVTLGILVGITGPGKQALQGLSAEGFKRVSLVVRSNSG